MNISSNLQPTTYNLHRGVNKARVGNVYANQADEFAKVQAEIKRAELAALKAKPVQYKLHQANEARKKVLDPIWNVVVDIKDAFKKWVVGPEAPAGPQADVQK